MNSNTDTSVAQSHYVLPALDPLVCADPSIFFGNSKFSNQDVLTIIRRLIYQPCLVWPGPLDVIDRLETHSGAKSGGFMFIEDLHECAAISAVTPAGANLFVTVKKDFKTYLHFLCNPLTHRCIPIPALEGTWDCVHPFASQSLLGVLIEDNLMGIELRIAGPDSTQHVRTKITHRALQHSVISVGVDSRDNIIFARPNNIYQFDCDNHTTSSLEVSIEMTHLSIGSDRRSLFVHNTCDQFGSFDFRCETFCQLAYFPDNEIMPFVGYEGGDVLFFSCRQRGLLFDVRACRRMEFEHVRGQFHNYHASAIRWYEP